MKKYTKYIDNISYNTEDIFRPHQAGFQFAFSVPNNIDSSVYYYDMYQTSVENGTHAYEYIESKYWNATDFPEEVRQELLDYGIENMLCAATNDLLYSGHYSGSNAHYVLVDLIVWDYDNETCQNIDDIYSQVSGVLINYLYIDARYDYNNLTNPIHYTINYNNFISVDEHFYKENFHTLHTNVAYNNDNTTTTFYSVDDSKSRSSYPVMPFLFTVYFTMGEEYDVYIPYIDYQPVITSYRRDLASRSNENILSPHYFIFYLIAQIGGFVAFFILLIGAKIKSMNESYLMYKTVNDYHEISKAENQQQDGQDNVANQLSFEQSLNLDRSRNSNQIAPRNRNSIVYEDDPLMYQNEGGSSDEQDAAEDHHQPVFERPSRI